MGDAAHAGSLKHEIFNRPFKVRPRYAHTYTPASYRDYGLGKDLPDKIKVWYVQNTGKTAGGVVSRSWGFNDSPDAELLVPGYNGGKEYGAMAVGRHGNFLQWGFAAPPSRMTDAGKRLFLNCICYIHKFDAKGPLIRTERGDRTYAVRDAMLINKVKDKRFFSGSFTPEQMSKYKNDPEGLAKYYTADYELIYKDRTYRIDEDLKALGLKSNRTLQTLERLIELLVDKQHAGTARRLLARCVAVSFETPEQWGAWLRENRDRIYFSDVGGYKFRVVPKGYLNDPTSRPQ